MRLPLLLTSCVLLSALHAQNSTPVASVPTAQFRFEKAEHDFGWVLQDSENIHVFRFKNTGKVPLIIENAEGSCGCTVPEYSKAPIFPGKESRIRVVYKPGQQEGDQLKTVTITANTKPATTVLRIHAVVLKAAPVIAPAPYTFEPLPPPAPAFDPLASAEVEDAYTGPTTEIAFVAMEHDFGKVLQGSENPHVFRFQNTGKEPLVISNAVGSCGCTVPYYAKAPIAPGAWSEIHVVYKPAQQRGAQQKTVTLTANTAPRQTLLRITADVVVSDAPAEPSFIQQEEVREKDRKAIEAVNPGCFVIFPNPTSQELRLDLKEHIGSSADVEIHDTAGKSMLHTTIASITSESSSLDIAAFPVGTYVCTIRVEDKAPMSQCFVVHR